MILFFPIVLYVSNEINTVKTASEIQSVDLRLCFLIEPDFTFSAEDKTIISNYFETQIKLILV